MNEGPVHPPVAYLIARDEETLSGSSGAEHGGELEAEEPEPRQDRAGLGARLGGDLARIWPAWSRGPTTSARSRGVAGLDGRHGGNRALAARSGEAGPLVGAGSIADVSSVSVTFAFALLTWRLAANRAG